jgi:hypothetical protein
VWSTEALRSVVNLGTKLLRTLHVAVDLMTTCAAHFGLLVVVYDDGLAVLFLLAALAFHDLDIDETVNDVLVVVCCDTFDDWH